MVEEWRPLLGDETLGMVSNLGRIKSSRGKVLFSKPAPNGYYYTIVVQRKRNIRQTIRIHRAVALAFCDGYKEGLTVNHIDGDKKNNTASNLEWLSHKNNIRHAYRLGLRKNNHRKPKIPHEDRNKIEEMIKNGTKIARIAEMYQVRSSCVNVYLHGRVKKTIIYDYAE